MLFRTKYPSDEHTKGGYEMLPYVLEACVESLQSAKMAEAAGFTRLELCQNLLIGGTQPAFSLFEAIREECALPVRVLMRPRFGDFLYDEDENERLLKDIKAFIAMGAEGIVVGHLTADGDLDVELLKRMREAAGTAGLTLHRAFDLCRNPEQALEEAIALGFDTILTSGQADKAQEGAERLRILQKQAGHRLQIMAGSGVNAENIALLGQNAGLSAFHLSATVSQDSPMRFRRESVHMGLKGLSEYTRTVADFDKMKAAVEAWKKLQKAPKT